VHIQVVNFQLKELDDAGFRAACDHLAPAFAAVPGLLSKVWLASPETGTYGGVYTWRDRAAMDAYLGSDLFKGVLANPHFANIASRDFGVLEGPTAVTHGLVAAPA
jgi:quinol monooxygenase YgiN